MKLTSEIIDGFATSILSSRFDEPAPTPDCHREWWEACTSEHKFVAIAAPRSHAKSTGITKTYGLASLLFREHDYALIVSDTYKQACLFLGELKNELVSNEPLIQYFGVKQLNTDREDDIVVEFNDGHKFRVMALGSEQKVRGLLWNGKRPNLILGDDLENDEIVQNPDRREKFRHWVYNALIPTMSAKGKMRIVGTILHMDAFLERLMPKEYELRLHRTPLSFIREPNKDNPWYSAKYMAHDDNFEHILWPEKWTQERLTQMRQMYIAQGNPEGYYQEFLNKPIDPSNALFKKDDFQEMTDEDRKLESRQFTHYLSVDLAVSTDQRRDYSVFVVGGVDERNILHIKHVVRERMDAMQIVDTIFKLAQRFQINMMVMEKGTIEKALGPYIRAEMMKRGKFINIHAINPSTDKVTRARSIQARMRAQGVKFDKTKTWYIPLEQEMLRFPKDLHDDQVDAMSNMGLIIDRFQEGPTIKELEEEDYLEDQEAYAELEMNEGRNSLTGY
jgi:predicted phage terminase large subunit-like protein